MESNLVYLFGYFAGLPLIRIAIIALMHMLLLPKNAREMILRGMIRFGIVLDFLFLVFAIRSFPVESFRLELHDFIFHGWYQILIWDQVSFAALILASISFTVIARFSMSYLHRDEYIHKFYLILYVFQFATALFIFSESTQFLFMGWELLGLSSVLLIAFYETRKTVLKNSLRVLVIYKISDLFLFGGFLYFLNVGALNTEQIQGAALTHPFYLWLLGVACLIKAGLFPWFWLPRAMEGPTTSSALFYGAVATHLPSFVFLRIWPSEIGLFHPMTLFFVVVLSIAVLFSTFLGRQTSDVKNMLAFATVTQLAIIFLEIIFGFQTLALIHVVSHGLYRGFEYLRSPSQLNTIQKIQRSRSANDESTGGHYKQLLPKRFRKWLYAITMKEFGLFKSSFGIIDHFLSLKNTRYNLAAFVKYGLFVLCGWFLIEFLFIELSTDQISFFEEGFLFIALLANIAAFRVLHYRALFTFLLSLSILLCFDVLETRVMHALVFVYIEWVAAFAACLGFVYLFISKLEFDEYNFWGKYRGSKTINMIVLVVGLSVVGIPGLGSYFLWESLVHEVAKMSPHLVFEAFYVLTTDAILFFVFYYFNYYGERHREHYYAPAFNKSLRRGGS